MVWYEGSGTSTRRWFHADERGSIVAVSDASGNATDVNSYDEYGIPATGGTAGALAGRFGYTGQAWVSELGMYYYRARIYSPTLGRFMQTDPIGYGGGMNLYAYVLNDPVNNTDPSGLCTIRAGNLWDVFDGRTGKYLGSEFGPTFYTADGCEGGWGRGPQVFDGGVGNAGGNGPDSQQCPAEPGTPFPTREEAALAAVRAARAQERAGNRGRGDNLERFFYGVPLQGGGYTFGPIGIGTRDGFSGRIPVSSVLAGHIHLVGGGNTLSRSTDVFRTGHRGDVEMMGDLLNALGRAGGDPSSFMTVLGAENGDVLAWYGRNLGGAGTLLGTDGCP